MFAAGMAAMLGLVGCGGGSDSSSDTGSGMGTLRLSLTDAPACGYDNVFVTVERVRVHKSGTAGDNDAGWSEVALPTPQRIDLLTLTNGTLLPLGQTELPAGTYTQMRLVLGSTTPPGWPAGTLANSIKPTGAGETALTTPSGQQSGLKMNVDIVVPAGQVADFAIDFNACKSFVKAGNSGKYLLKPVLSVIPILSPAGQRIVGFVDPSLVNAGTTVSAQFAGAPAHATQPDTTGRFVLYPVPPGTYDLVITASGRVNAVMTGVPVGDASTTVIGSDAVRINTPSSAVSYIASGTVAVGGSTANTDGHVRALQSFATGPTFEVAGVTVNSVSGEYSFMLPAGEPVKTAYVVNPVSINFAPDIVPPPQAGKYLLEATLPTLATKTTAITLTADTVTNFVFP
jgi:Domain of unknown function (DUF4382)